MDLQHLHLTYRSEAFAEDLELPAPAVHRSATWSLLAAAMALVSLCAVVASALPLSP